MKNYWWKIAGVVLVIYTIIAGFLLPVPALPILNESIRNLYFHVTMWFGLMIILTISLVYSIRFLSNNKIQDDIVAAEAIHVGMLFATVGILTGMVWANFTWGAPWVNDPKLNGVAIAMLFYLAYMILRNAIDDEMKRARVAAVYNIFSFAMFIVFIWVMPRLTDSLHPGNGGNPGFGKFDLDNRMRMVFYPAVLGWSLLGIWMLQLRIRIRRLKDLIDEKNDEKTISTFGNHNG